MKSLERNALIRLALFLLIGLLIGKEFDAIISGVLISLACYTCFFIADYFLFLRWLDNPQRKFLPIFSGSWLPITQRLERERIASDSSYHELEEEQLFFIKAFNAIESAVVVIDNQYRIEWANKTANRLMNINDKLDRGQIITQLYRSPEFDNFIQSADHLKRSLELKSAHHNDLWLRIEAARFETSILIFARDVTEEVKMETIRTDFVGNVSHELKTPLTVITGYLDAMESNLDAIPAPWIKAISSMKEQSVRMNDMVTDLLWLTKLESIPPDSELELVPMENLLRGIVDEARLAKPEAELSLELIEGDNIKPNFKVLGSYNELRSAFSNIIFNAIKYGGETPSVTIQCCQYFKTIEISVSDNGEGISPEHIPRLTERFYRVDDSRTSTTGGTGLGLAIVKHILNRHDGTLRITSKIGKGSRFACVFPITRIVNEKPSVSQI